MSIRHLSLSWERGSASLNDAPLPTACPPAALPTCPTALGSAADRPLLTQLPVFAPEQPSTRQPAVGTEESLASPGRAPLCHRPHTADTARAEPEVALGASLGRERWRNGLRKAEGSAACQSPTYREFCVVRKVSGAEPTPPWAHRVDCTHTKVFPLPPEHSGPRDCALLCHTNGNTDPLSGLGDRRDLSPRVGNTAESTPSSALEHTLALVTSVTATTE